MANKRARRELIRILAETRNEVGTLASDPDEQELRRRLEAGHAAGARWVADHRGQFDR